MNGPNIVSTTDLGTIGQDSKILDANGNGITIVADQASTYYATDGNDQLIVPANNQSSPTLVGGTGEDSFYLQGNPGQSPTIVNFTHAQDQIILNVAAFDGQGSVGGEYGQTQPGLLQSSFFSSGPNDPLSVGAGHFFYNTSQGDLLYGVKAGAGSIAASTNPIANLQGAPTLTASDIRFV